MNPFSLMTTAALGAAQGGISALGGAIGPSAALLSRMTKAKPTRAARRQAAKRKAPFVARVQKAAEIRSVSLAEAVERPYDASSVQVIAREAAHSGDTGRKLVEDLTDKGFLSTGSVVEDLKNGAIHWGDAWFSLYSWVLGLTTLKSASLYPPLPANTPFFEALFPKVDALRVPTGARYIMSEGDTRVLPDDIWAQSSAGIVFLVGPDGVKRTNWPADSYVITGVVPVISINWETFVRLAAAMLAMSREAWYLKGLAFFTERLPFLKNFGFDLTRAA